MKNIILKYFTLIILFALTQIGYSQTQKRSLNNNVRYNSSVNNKTYVYPEEKELKIKNKDYTYKGEPIDVNNDSIGYDHLTLIKYFSRNKVQNITQVSKPRFGLSKNYNSYLKNGNVQMLA